MIDGVREPRSDFAEPSAADDATVVGAGIVGISCAMYLQRAGFRVTVVDPEPPGSGASSGNAGVIATVNRVPLGTPSIWRGLPKMLFDPASPLSIRWTYLPRMAPWIGRLALASRPAEVERISSALTAILERAHDAYEPLLSSAGAAHLVRRRGWLHLFETAESFASARYDLGVRRARGVEMEVIEGRAIRDFEPGLQSDFHRAVYYPDPAHTVDPRHLVQAFASRFAADGGIVESARIRRIELAAGRPRLVRDDGTGFSTGIVVIAAGAWSGTLAAMAGNRVPLDTERGYHVMLPRPGIEIAHPLVLFDRKFAVTPMQGGLRLAGTVEFAGLAAPPNAMRPRAMLDQVRKLFPDLNVEGATDWLGFRPSLPDSLPVIGRSAASQAVLFAFGHGHLGLTLGPVTGRIIADLARGRRPELDVTPFGPGRFR